jgi:hypothetical protein
MMNTELMKVVQQGEAFAVQSQKAEGGQIKKCNILLQELGGKFENQFAAQLWGNAAECRFQTGDVVAVRLRFQTREHNGQVFQDISVQEIVKLN